MACRLQVGRFAMLGCVGAMRGLRPIVVLMNNGGWGIFRPIAGREDLLTIPNWPYAERATTFALIETRVDPHDLSPVSKKYIEASARKAGIARKSAAARNSEAVRKRDAMRKPVAIR